MTTVAVEATGTLPLEQLDPAHWPNPRGDVDTTSPAFADLQASIAAQGILEPIIVGPALAELDGRHPIIAGWRRYTAALAAGMADVPVHHRPDIADRRAALRAALAENMAREDMTPIAEASAIATLVELGDTQVEAAKAVGVSERTARERLRLLELPAAVRQAIDAGHVPTTCTRQLQVIADASAVAAREIAKKIEDGSVRAYDLLADERLDRVLSGLSAKAGLVKLTSWTSLSALSLPKETSKDLRDRNKKAMGYGDGGQINIDPASVGKALLDGAAADGKLVRLTMPYGDVVYLAGADWHEKAAQAAVKRAEDAAAQRKPNTHAHVAPPAPVAGGDEQEDPEQRERRERQEARDQLEDEIDERARPHAAHMNTELGRRLRDLTSIAIDGPVARVLIELGLVVDSDGPAFAIEGYRLVDPDNRWAQYSTTYEDGAFEAWEAAIREASTPEHAAAEIVKPIIACVFADPRSGGGVIGASVACLVLPELEQHVRAAALALDVLPERAVRLHAARSELDEERVMHRHQADRRRILHELEKGRLDLETLFTRANAWGRECGALECVAVAVHRRHDFDAALEQLADAGHVKRKTVATADTVTITAAGRTVLHAPPSLAPIIADIDAGAELPDEPDEPHDDDAGNGVTRRSQVLALIDAQPGITIPELAERMAIKQNTLYRLLPSLVEEGKLRKEGRGWYPQLEITAAPAPDVVVVVHVTPTTGGDPVEAELQPDPVKRGQRKVIYTTSRTEAWVAENRITDLPTEDAA